jgi:transcriptional regulator with XRE-family HTH domain
MGFCQVLIHSSKYAKVLILLITGQEVRNGLGKAVRFYRKQRRLSQAELAEKADISITFLSKIERGIKFPTSETLSGLANGLEVEVYQLFRNDETPLEQWTLFERFKKDITKNINETLENIYREYEK